MRLATRWSACTQKYRPSQAGWLLPLTRSGLSRVAEKPGCLVTSFQVFRGTCPPITNALCLLVHRETSPDFQRWKALKRDGRFGWAAVVRARESKINDLAARLKLWPDTKPIAIDSFSCHPGPSARENS